MVDPYLMVAVNIIISLLLVCGIFIYKILFPQKKINFFLLLILISIIPIISVFRKGVYESGDFIIHAYHTIDFFNALHEGILIPSWAAGLNSGFGHPVFTFIYIIPYYIMSLLHFLGFSYIFSEKLTLAGAYILSGVSMWFVLKKLVKNDLASFAGSILYLFAPFHFVDIHFRVAIGESISFVIIPAIFFLILKTKEEFKFIFVAWMGLLLGILFLNHPAMFVIYSALFIVFVLFELIFKKSNKNILISFSLSMGIGLIICSFGWLPRILLISLTQGAMLANSTIAFVSPRELLYSVWRLGFLFQGPYGRLSYAIGYGGIIILLLSILFLIKNRKNRSNYYLDVLFWATISVLTLFIMLPYSKMFWETFKFLSLMQFSYRFLHVLTFSIAILTGLMTLYFQKRQRLIFIFLFLCISYTILNWGNRRSITTIDDTWIINNLPNGTKQGEKMLEATPIWWNTKKDFLFPVKDHLQVVSGNAEIKEIQRTTTKHLYLVQATGKATLVENTLYFPDWKVYINGNSVPINYETKRNHGTMVFEVPDGINYIEASYNDIREIKIAKRVSAILFISLVAYLILYYTSKMIEFISNELNIKKNEKK